MFVTIPRVSQKMTDQFNNFLAVLTAFEEHKVDYILIGGVAVILHGLERLTRDIDIFIKLVPENIDNMRQALNSVFNDESIKEITEDELGTYPVVRYGTPQGFYIDIMARLGGAVSFEDIQCEIIEYDGVQIKIATPEALYKLKKNTMRDKDRLDIQFLRQIIQTKSEKK